MLVVFVMHPAGTEGHVRWFYLSLPGSIPALLLSDLVYNAGPRAEPVIEWVLIICFNFGWYWAFSYAVIMIIRAVR